MNNLRADNGPIRHAGLPDPPVTARLMGEPISRVHLAEIRRLHRDRQVMATLSAEGRVLPDPVTLAGLERQEAHWHVHGFGLWVFRCRASGEFVGRAGLMRYEIVGRTETGLAYAVLSDLWGRGLATEMAEISLRIGFEGLGMPEVASWTLPHNHASRRVLEKLGFRFERAGLFAGLPHRFYRLRREDRAGAG